MYVQAAIQISVAEDQLRQTLAITSYWWEDWHILK